MKLFQTRILQLDMCVIFISLICSDFSKSSADQRIRQNINKTVFEGETVTLHCNKTPFDEDLTWTMNNTTIFSHDSNKNTTYTNFSSNRIHIDPAAPRELKIHQIQASDAGNYACYPATIEWTLTVNQTSPDSSKQKLPDLYIITLCSGVIMVCLIITISICIHRRWKKSKTSEGHTETRHELTDAPVRRGIQTQRSQYFEKYNSVYGKF